MSAKPLSEATRRDLLDLARRALAAHFSGSPAPRLPSDRAEAFGEPRGLFVTLRLRGELRGCIGTLAPDGDLSRMVPKFALRAAFGDPLDSAEVYATNEQDAEAVLGPGSHNGNPDTPVYLITMHGLFQFRGSAPDGVNVPPGHFMAIVVGTDLEGRSSSFGNMIPDTSSLGPGIELIG